jgi:hypothetical protein
MTSKAFGLAQLGNAYADGALSNRNLIINGAMQVAQRGTSGTSGYLLDRWNGLGTSAQSQSSDAPAGFTNSFEFTLGTAGFPNAMQRIERANSAHLAGNNVTVSFWAKNLSGSSNLFVEIYRAGSNDNFGSVSLEGFVEVASSPSLSWTYYTATFALSASATTGLELRIVRNNVEPASTRITGVQLEAGDTATPFEHRSYGQELALCQRYYWKNKPAPLYAYIALGRSQSTYVNFLIQYPQVMRAAPTFNYSNLRVEVGTLTTALATYAGDTSALYQLNTTSGATIGQVNPLQSNSAGVGFLEASAEL